MLIIYSGYGICIFVDSFCLGGWSELTRVRWRVQRVAEPHVRVVVRVHVSLRRRRARALLGPPALRLLARLGLRGLGVLLQLVDLVRGAVVLRPGTQQLQLGARGPGQVFGGVVPRDRRPASAEPAHQHGAQRRAIHGVERQCAVVRSLIIKDFN